MSTATTQQVSEDQVAWFAAQFAAMRSNVAQVIRGKASAIDLALLCLLSEGHLLIEDIPGVGKTSLARALAASMGGRLQRIQFTPDLLPSDVTGVAIYNQTTHEFEFKPGPVFANVVLGDEINRASPKTQSALLEVMEEYQVTVDGLAHPVPRPFLVMATQNPVDLDGTYQLPEAQLDRFLMRISMGYPDAAAEAEILDGHRTGTTVEDLGPVTTAAEARQMIDIADHVHLDPRIRDYLIAVVASTRDHPDVRLGASPRASIALMRAARSRAASVGRTFVLPDDIQDLAAAVLGHRLMLSADASLRQVDAADIVAAALRDIPTPKPG